MMVASKKIGAEANPISTLLLTTFLKLKTAAIVIVKMANLPIVPRFVCDMLVFL